jgi:hypothetical protein
MFRTSLCPSSGEQEQDWLKLHVKIPGCAGCGCVEPWYRQCALFESSCSTAVSLCASSASRTGVLCPPGRYPDTQETARWLDPRAGLHTFQ